MEDNVAANPATVFKVESFEPTENFKPTKPYLTRIKWRDQEGNEQSKLLLTKPTRCSPWYCAAPRPISLKRKLQTAGKAAQAA